MRTEFRMPVRTEMAYLIPASNIYLIGLCKEPIQYTAAKIKYLAGVGFALSVALNYLDGQITETIENFVEEDLDAKEFLPRQYSGNNLSEMSGAHVKKTLEALGVESQTQNSSEIYPCVNLPRCTSNSSTSSRPTVLPSDTYNSFLNRMIEDDFSFPVLQMPVCSPTPDNLSLECIRNLVHVTDGSNSNIFLGTFQSETVIVKIIKEKAMTDPIAILEFDIEYAMLSRFNHPNILKVLGAGKNPRQFIVLEYLGGGTLYHVLNRQETPNKFRFNIFKRPT